MNEQQNDVEIPEIKNKLSVFDIFNNLIPHYKRAKFWYILYYFYWIYELSVLSFAIYSMVHTIRSSDMSYGDISMNFIVISYLVIMVIVFLVYILVKRAVSKKVGGFNEDINLIIKSVKLDERKDYYVNKNGRSLCMIISLINILIIPLLPLYFTDVEQYIYNRIVWLFILWVYGVFLFCATFYSRYYIIFDDLIYEHGETLQ
jgi:hydrogenase-4 membrane subunit HyfE